MERVGAKEEGRHQAFGKCGVFHQDKTFLNVKVDQKSAIFDDKNNDQRHSAEDEKFFRVAWTVSLIKISDNRHFGKLVGIGENLQDGQEQANSKHLQKALEQHQSEQGDELPARPGVKK